MDDSFDHNEVLRFWAEADDLVDGYLQAIALLHERAKVVGSQPSHDIDLRRLDAVVDARREHSDDIVDPRESKRRGDAIDPSEPGFLQAVENVQRDVKRRVGHRLEDSTRLDWTVLRHLERLLSEGDFEVLEQVFGTPSNVWDLLVTLKYDLSLPRHRDREIDSWLVAVVTEGERFLRDILALTFRTVGPTLLPQMVRVCVNDPPEEFNPPRSSDGQGDRDDLPETVVDIVRFLGRGSRETTEIARRVAGALDFPLYPDGQGFDPGFVTILGWLGDSTRDIWTELLSARRRLLHDTAGTASSPFDDTVAVLHPRSGHDLALVADFVGALGLRFGLHLLKKVLGACGTPSENGAELWHQGLVWKMPGELRTMQLQLLGEARWPMAWALAEMALDVEPRGNVSKMLTLNALYARQRMQSAYGLSDEFLDPVEIERIDVSDDDPRYQLIKRSMLRQFDGVDAVLDEALSKDMVLYEIETWPALWELRQSSEYARWRAGIDRLGRTT